MVFQLLARLLVLLMVVTGNQVNANWSITFYESWEQCTGEDSANRKHYYVFSGDPSLWQGNPSLRSECFTPGGDRIQEGIDRNMICAETFDGGATMQQCGPSILFKLQDWSWSVTAGSSCSWGPIRPYVNTQGICQNLKSEPTGTSECFSGEHEMQVQAHGGMTMLFSCGCSGTSDTCKPSNVEKREEEVDDKGDNQNGDRAVEASYGDILTGCQVM